MSIQPEALADARIARLYLIGYLHHEYDEPVNYDLMVLAYDAQHAIDLWRAYYQGVYHDPENIQDCAVTSAKPDHVIRIPEEELLSRNPRVIEWGSMDYEA